jgi:hypothetical protein
MSKALDIADLLRTRLITAPSTGELATPQDITAVPVIVDRQKDILSSVSVAVGKTSGCAITILWRGFAAVDDNSHRPAVENAYVINVWSKPVIAGGNLTADDVMQSVLLRLWHWVPGGGHSNRECRVKNGGLVPHKSFLIYDCEVTIPALI